MNNNKYPLVSVIMNCYNGEEFLRESIESVLAQTYTNFEIIFWDNQSTDKSADIVKSYSDPRIKYFYADKHTSLGEARNLALNKTKGEYIAFLDVDDVWLPEKLDNQVPLFQDKIGLVYCSTETINSKGIIINNNKPSISSQIFIKNLGDLMDEYDIVLSSAIISKNALQNLNKKFDNLLQYSEEYDLFLRILISYQAVYYSKILALYRIHKNQDTLKLFERSIYEQEYIFLKLMLIYPDYFNNKRIYNQKKKIALTYFLNNIIKNNTVAARRSIFPYMFSSWKYFLYYIISFMGSNAIKFFWDKKRGKEGKLTILS